MKHSTYLQVAQNRNVYSPEAQRRTIEALDALYVHVFMHENRCHLKNASLAKRTVFGAIDLEDAMALNYYVRQKDGTAAWHYETLENLVNDGWVLD